MQNVYGRNILRGATLVAAGIIIVVTATAQEMRVALGAGGSYHTTMGKALFGYPDSLSGPCSDHTTNERGSISGYSAHVEIRLAPLAGIEDLGLNARLRWQYMEGESRSEPQENYGDVQNVSYPITYTTQERHAFTMQSAYLDILAEYHLPWSFLIKGGPSIGYRRFDEMITIQEIIAPEHFRFLNEEGLPTEMNGSSIICYDKELWPDGNGMSLGLIAQLGMSIRTTGRVVLAPEIGLRWEMLPPVNPWPTLELSAGLSIRYTFGDEP